MLQLTHKVEKEGDPLMKSILYINSMLTKGACK